MDIINPYRFASGGGGSTTLKNGLIGAWEFEETSGTTAVDIHSTYDGTISGGVVVGASEKPANFSTSYQFTGTSPLVTVTSTSALRPSNFSVSFWVYINNIELDTSLHGLFSAPGGPGTTSGWRLNYDKYSSGRIRLESGNGSTSNTRLEATGLNAEDAAWMHVVATYDGTDAYLYVNNTQRATLAITIDTSSELYDMRWGYGNGLAYFTDGYMGQTLFYDRALTTTEISQIYNSGNGLKYSSF